MCQTSATVSVTTPKGSHKNSKLVKMTLLKARSKDDNFCELYAALSSMQSSSKLPHSAVSGKAHLSCVSLRFRYTTRSSLTSCKAVEHSKAQSIGFRNVARRLQTVHRPKTSSSVKMLPPAYRARRKYSLFSEPLAAVEARSSDTSLSLSLSASSSTLLVAGLCLASLSLGSIGVKPLLVWSGSSLSIAQTG